MPSTYLRSGPRAQQRVASHRFSIRRMNALFYIGETLTAAQRVEARIEPLDLANCVVAAPKLRTEKTHIA
jgi:hypothetical protein